MSGAMKTFLDRIGSWVHTLALSGKMGIVVTVTDQSGQEFVSYYLQKLLLQMGCNVVGEYKVVALEELDQEEVIERIVSNIVKAFSDQEQYISTADLENTFQYLKARFVNADMEQYKDESYEIKYWYADVLFEDVHIPASALIGKEGEGFKIAMKTLEQGRAGVGSGCVGIMKAAMEVCVKYAQERTTMGKPIYKNQAISSKIADMEIAIETSRAIGMKVAALLDAGDPLAATLGPIAKCYCSDALNRVTTEAVQILGGYGYMRDYPVEKLMRDAKIFQIFEGTNEIQRVVISGNVIRKNKIK